MFGYIGGRKAVACEFYKGAPPVAETVKYTYGLNVYWRMQMPCSPALGSSLLPPSFRPFLRPMNKLRPTLVFLFRARQPLTA